jgi:hypothetical protein
MNTRQETTDSVYAITTYHPNFNGLRNTINENWDFLSRNLSTRHLHSLNRIFGHRRPPNLRDQLVRAKITTREPPESKKMTKRCNRKNCRYCSKIDTSGSILDPYSKRTYITRCNVTCLSQNLIYAIQCKKCNKLYVGQTKRQLTKRLYEHFRDVEQENPQKSLGNQLINSNPTGKELKRSGSSDCTVTSL